jgi:tetratricopeptide (TPR) repeat protein
MICKLNNCPPHPGRRLLLQSLGLLCILVMPAQPALAGTPTPYGEYFVRLGQSWPDAGSVTPWPEPVPGSAGRDSARYQRQLERLEDEGGPYADALAEPLADLARLYRSSGDILQAQQAYRRALHVVRINEGLYSERQVPILRELFETYRMTGDMATLDARYDYFFRLYGSGQAPYTPVRMGAALEYLRWQREALRLGLDEQDTERLLRLYSLNEQMLQGAAADPDVEFTSYRALALSQLCNLYLLQERYEPRVETIGSVTSTAMPGAWDEEDPGQRRLETLQRNALARGRTLLEELISRTPPGQVEDLAGAWLELADWNQWNDRHREALVAYGQVVTLLQEAGRAQLLEQWLGQPVELPANGAFWQPRPLPAGAGPIVVQASYDVSASGRASNVEVAALASEDDSKAGRVRRNLTQTRFRPRMVNGEPEAQMHLSRDYEVLN